MQSVLINRTKVDLEQQFEFLKRFESYLDLQTHKPFILILSGLTLFVLGLMTLTSTDILITLKGVSFILISLAWLIFLNLPCLVLV
jgi:hypothetical protein